MTKSYFPFDAGAGSIVQESQWSKMARIWKNDGVLYGMLNSLETFGNSTGMQVRVKSGQAWVRGHFFESDAEEVLSIATAHSTLNRYDRVVVRLNWINNTIDLAVITGTAAASPTIPALTQNETVWEIALASVFVAAATSTINAAAVSDERPFANGDDGNFSLPVILGNGIDVITSGLKGYVEVPTDCLLTGWRIAGNVSGSIVVDVWKDTYANFPPTVADTIMTGVKPTLSGAHKNQNTGLRKMINAGDWLAFNVDSVANVKQVTLTLLLRKVH